MAEPHFETTTLENAAERPAPDGSMIRLLPTLKGGGLCHCTLQQGQVSRPVRHRSIEEIWYVLEGEGEVWRETKPPSAPVRVSPGTCLTIPPRTGFQFRNTGANPLRILIATMPPWPGKEEAEPSTGMWQSTFGHEAEP